MPDEPRSRCHACGNYRIRARGRLHRGHFVCGIQCWGKYFMAEWQQWEDERVKRKKQELPPNVLRMKEAK